MVSHVRVCWGDLLKKCVVNASTARVNAVAVVTDKIVIVMQVWSYHVS